MGEIRYAMSYDIGTTGVKTCIFSIGDTIELIAGASAGYNLYVLDGGGLRIGVLICQMFYSNHRIGFLSFVE